MNAVLLNLTGKEEIPLVDNTVIGRAPAPYSHITVDDEWVSAQHALIRRGNRGDYRIVDMGSRNGTFLNETRLERWRPLQHGDVVRIGRHSFVFRTQGTVGIPGFNLPPTKPDTKTLKSVILVSDVWGFTTKAEKLPPADLAAMMGGWYDHCSEVIEATEGRLDKFIGDAVLAYWPSTDFPIRQGALQAAIRIVSGTGSAAPRDADGGGAEEGPEFRSSAALHLGEVAEGPVGAQAFTVLGDTVNTAFRLEGLCREVDEPIIVSGEFLDGWDLDAPATRSLGSYPVKGREQKIDVHALSQEDGGSG